MPSVTAKLGTVLDCTIAHGNARAFVDEWKGFQLLTGVNAFTSSRPCLYFVKGRLGGDPGISERAARAGSNAYKRWHQRDPQRVGDIETEPCEYQQGRMLRLGYRSDKWGQRGRAVAYDHDFLEDGGSAPLVWTNTRTLEAATTIVVVGGSMRVTERGIA